MSDQPGHSEPEGRRLSATRVAPEPSRDLGGSDELRALGRLTFDELGRAVGGIGSVHRAISDRSFGATGSLGRPAKLAHDAIAHGVYTAVRTAGSLLGRAGDLALSQRLHRPEEVSSDSRGAQLLAIVNGLIGDSLLEERPELAQAMEIRVGGHRVEPEPAALARAFPDAGSRIVVFLHGLFENEAAWRYGAEARGGTYADTLAAELGLTPVFIRFNTGRRISDNGRSLSALLDRITAAWPAELTEIALVGHSMGGLVARSACHYAAEGSHEWTAKVGHVVSLGTPHYGSPVEGSVHVASAALDVFAETRPFSRFLRRRSGGIRDLRAGSIVDEDWKDCDPDSLRRVICAEVPLLEGATHCFVAATITRSPEHPLGRLFGDSLVLGPSASGIDGKRRIGFRDEHGLRLGGTHHLALLNHPAVEERLLEWLAQPGRRRAGEPIALSA